jgi:hypothetical protein
MRSFLSKIRKGLINQGSAKRYLIYAIGEIALVVIGILLALQINIWNEHRKANKIEKEYLTSLEKEFEENKTELHNFVLLNNQLIATAKEFLNYTGKNSINDISEDEINVMLIDLIKANVEYEPSPGILEDLISSGNLNNLSNATLRTQLSTWKAKLAKVRRQENTVLEYRSNIKKLLIEKGNTRAPVVELLGIGKGNFGIENKILLTDNRLENNLSFFAISSFSLGINYYGDLEKHIEDILETIRYQLKE